MTRAFDMNPETFWRWLDGCEEGLGRGFGATFLTRVEHSLRGRVGACLGERGQHLATTLLNDQIHEVVYTARFGPGFSKDQVVQVFDAYSKAKRLLAADANCVMDALDVRSTWVAPLVGVDRGERLLCPLRAGSVPTWRISAHGDEEDLTTARLLGRARPRYVLSEIDRYAGALPR